jgi:hypothetical protein
LLKQHKLQTHLMINTKVRSINLLKQHKNQVI